MREDKRGSVRLLIALIVIMGVLTAFMWWPWNWHMPGMMGMTGFGWGFMFLIPLAFLTLMALGAYYLITEFMGTIRYQSGSSRRALDILKERYAKGEITREQYLRMKEELE